MGQSLECGHSDGHSSITPAAEFPLASPRMNCCVESVEGDCDPRQVEKPDGRIIALAKVCVMKALACNGSVTVLDVRDPNEVAISKGGQAYAEAIHCPINVDGQS